MLKGTKLGMSLWDKFFSHVEKTDTCWLWTASKCGIGYGRFAVNRKPQQAHRVSWFLHFGEIPTKLFVCHSCDNRQCVNPRHLFLGTQKDNMSDAKAKGRMRSQFPLYNLDHPRAKLSSDDVVLIRTSGDKNRQLATKLGVHITTIQQIRSGRRRTHVEAL